MRREYELSEEEYRELRAASQPVLYLVAGGREPIDPYEHVSALWQRIARKHGICWESIAPSPKGNRFFTADAKAEGR